jgi:predicted enzyme related to lactoylglutathione lyase
MTTRNEPWPEGTPAWADLMVPDRHQARAFYGGLLGWDFSDEAPAEMGYYTQALKDGRNVAGFGEMTAEGGPPPVWTTYLAVDQLEPVVERATDAGATVLMPPMDVADNGRLAVLADPTGAVFGLWQSGTHTGAMIADEPGTMTWNEVMSRDWEKAKEFYGAVFGFTFGDMSGEGFQYATLDLDGRPVGGIGELPEEMPADIPAHWMTYFAVDDADAAVARVRELGGEVRMEPQDTPYGRMAVVAGPAGEVFSLMGPAPSPAPGDDEGAVG